MSTSAHRTSLPPTAILPGDAGYEQGRRVWNGTIDRRPLAIVPCRTVDDVVQTVRAAADQGVPLAVRGGGHSLPGFSTCDGGIVLDLAPMSGVRVDADSRTALVGGGATWRDVDAATEPFGLATTGGLVSSTGVGGLTLGGGIGWLTRRCGLACDNLLGATLVTAAGDVVIAGADADPELLWGLRGGGGNFGVVTEFEFRLHPVPTVTGGMAMFDAERAREVFAFWREWVSTLAEELTPMLVLLEGPPVEGVPKNLHGRPVLAIAGCDVADAHRAAEHLAPVRDLRPDLFAFDEMPYTSLQRMFDADLPAGDRYYFKGGFGSAYPDSMLDVLLEHFDRRPGPRCEVDVHHMGGAASRVGDMDTAFPGRSAAFTSNVYACWTDPAQDDAHRAWARDLAAALHARGDARNYVNFMSEVDASLAEVAYGDERLARLRELKRRHDPSNLFRLNHNVAP